MPRRDDPDEEELEVADGVAGADGRGDALRERREGEEELRPAVALDRVDRRILELLRDDGRLPVAALAERAGISRANAYTRLERLRTEGVIRGFSATVDSRRLGLGIAALILIAGRQPARRSLREQLLRMPEIECCAFTTGEYDPPSPVPVPDLATRRDVIL